jgi:hypothetical protein
MRPLRSLWDELHLLTHASFYSGDAHPSVLFNGVKFRLAILIQEISSETPNYYSTVFQRWFSEARPNLFANISYVRSDAQLHRLGLMPKFGAAEYRKIISSFVDQRKTIGSQLEKSSKYVVYSHRIVAHFVKAMNFVPYFRSDRDGEKKSEDYKVFCVRSDLYMHALSSVLNSTCFYLWFVAYSDVYHCGREIIQDFPLDLEALVMAHGKELRSANLLLMTNLQKNCVRRSIRYKKTGLVKYDEFYPRESKPYIDEIDRILARHFQLSPAEEDFVLNYDIKYRLSNEESSEIEDDD